MLIIKLRDKRVNAEEQTYAFEIFMLSMTGFITEAEKEKRF
jgi:hypothetical protein